jgi:hypothetical protein
MFSKTEEKVYRVKFINLKGEINTKTDIPGDFKIML